LSSRKFSNMKLIETLHCRRARLLTSW